jgi:ABC-type uncharacterized transport system substrate-binding protein
VNISRRELAALIGGAAAWPLFARAQQAAVPVIGYLSSRAAGTETAADVVMRDALRELGFVADKNVAFNVRWGGGDYSILPKLAAELIKENVTVIYASGLPAALAAKAATSTIPIVFSLAVDPVAFGLVQSINRPGGNVTGVMTLFDPLTPKKIELLHELVPTVAAIGFIFNPKNQNAASHQDHAQRAAKALGLQLNMLPVSVADGISPAFAEAARQRTGAVLIGDDPSFGAFTKELIEAAARSRIPTMYYVRDFVFAGGLISYGPSYDEMAKDVGVYLGRILRGEKPAELPVVQPTKIELVINLKTAKTLGLKIPQTLLAAAERVIE